MIFHNGKILLIKFGMKKCCASNQNTLAFLKCNLWAKIIAINPNLEQKYFRRLLELGFLPGAKVQVIKKSLTNQTILVGVGGCVFIMKKNIASYVQVSI